MGDRLFESPDDTDETDLTHMDDEFRPMQSGDETTESMRDVALSFGTESRHPIARLFEAEGRRILIEYALDCVLDDDRELEFQSKAALARSADTSRQTVSQYADDIAAVGIFETKGDKRLQYRPDTDSEVLRLLVEANDQIVLNARKN